MKIMFSRASQNRIGLVAAIAAAAVAALGLTACGGSETGQADLTLVRQQTAAHVHKEERLRKLERELRRVGSKPANVRVTVNGVDTPASTPPVYPSYGEPGYGSDESSYASASSGRSCGGEISVNSVTTCPFAANVSSAYFEEIGSGSGSVEAYSPRTGETYVMYCTGYPHECSGGDNAAVYFP